jgi:transglutaminase-like putative cysteine protease
MLLTITHNTTYHYTPAVETAHHIARLQPLTLASQTLLSHRLDIAPAPTPNAMHQRLDAFGNAVAQWSLSEAHEHLQVLAHSTVQTQTTEPPAATEVALAWERCREHYRYRSGQSADAQAVWVLASHHVPLDSAFGDYARADFGVQRPLAPAAIALMQRMYREFTYASQSTDIHTPAREAFQARCGVCQDFSHILLACLRSLGLAARYVSGYLLTHPPEGQARLIGSDASHAWVALHVPNLQGGAGHWLHLDPTNNRSGWDSPGADYVQIATGRDFNDVSPLRGVIHGGASHTLDVAVTVQPLGGDLLSQTHPNLAQPHT